MERRRPEYNPAYGRPDSEGEQAHRDAAHGGHDDDRKQGDERRADNSAAQRHPQRRRHADEQDGQDVSVERSGPEIARDDTKYPGMEVSCAIHTQ